jgi:hypothetical protein
VDHHPDAQAQGPPPSFLEGERDYWLWIFRPAPANPYVPYGVFQEPPPPHSGFLGIRLGHGELAIWAGRTSSFLHDLSNAAKVLTWPLP